MTSLPSGPRSASLDFVEDDSERRRGGEVERDRLLERRSHPLVVRIRGAIIVGDGCGRGGAAGAEDGIEQVVRRQDGRGYRREGQDQVAEAEAGGPEPGLATPAPGEHRAEDGHAQQRTMSSGTPLRPRAPGPTASRPARPSRRGPSPAAPREPAFATSLPVLPMPSRPRRPMHCLASSARQCHPEERQTPGPRHRARHGTSGGRDRRSPWMSTEPGTKRTVGTDPS